MHEDVGILRCEFGPHGCSVCLDEERTTAKNRTDLLRRQTRDTVDRVPFVIQYFPGAEKLRNLLRSVQHVIDEDEHLAKAIPHPHFLPSNNCTTSNRPLSAANYPAFRSTVTTTTQPCHSNLCKMCRIIDTDAIISRENTIHQVHTLVTRPTLST